MSKKTNVRALSVTAVMAAVLAPAAAWAGPHDAVSSDGMMIRQSEAANYMGGAKASASPFAGAKRVTADALIRDGISDAGRELTAAEVQAMAALPDGARARQAAPEVIIAADTRERVYTTYYPSRARVLITFSAGRCSGTLIGHNTVITAGHCVHSGGSGGNWYSTASFRIYAGANGGTSGGTIPYGSCTAKSLHSVVGWTNSANEAFDYGAIKLNCSVGNTVGWYGWTTGVALNDLANIGGYPGDKPLTQWVHADKVRSLTTDQLFYQTDTQPGSSGSGVWKELALGPYLIGVHAYGTHGAAPHSTNNHGKRVTAPTSTNFSNWKALP